MAGSGQFKTPNPGRFTRQDLTTQNGATDEVAVDAFFGAQTVQTMAGGGVRIARSPDAVAKRARRLQPWIAKGGQKTGVAAPPPDRTEPVQFVSGVRRPYRGAATILRGPAKIGLADPRVRPAVIVRGSVPPGRRAVIQPTRLPGAERIGLADPRSQPPRIVIGGSHRNRGQVIQPRGAARISSSDPLTRPSLSVRGPLPVGRTLRRQPSLTRGAAKIGTADPKPLATRVATALRRPYRGTATFVRGAAKISPSDPRTQLSSIVRAQSVLRVIRQPWIGRHAKDTPVVAQDRSRSPLISIPASARARIRIQPRIGKPVRLGDTDAITRPAKVVSARRSQRATRQPWLARFVKDTPLVVTGRMRAVTVIAGPARRRAVTQPFVSKPIRSDARLTRALTVLPSSRPVQPRIQPWMPAAARTVATSAHAASLVQQAPNRSRRRGVVQAAWLPKVAPNLTRSGASLAPLVVIGSAHAALTRTRHRPWAWRSPAAIDIPDTDLTATFVIERRLWASLSAMERLSAAGSVQRRLSADWLAERRLRADASTERRLFGAFKLESQA